MHTYQEVKSFHIYICHAYCGHLFFSDFFRYYTTEMLYCVGYGDFPYC